ncbi:response regulator [Pseudomonas sp. UL073]|uniref:Response regulator n=1 Tax=Zestomonas insulae TaxID=2809017 RepID=A0ABS2IHL1_9GAMM|nr:response regulator [Pseudomonas insulae]MBM7062561.1 response regulator [Pseudomonas insulae]
MPNPESPESSPKSVLLVEDDDIVRLLTVEVLEELGYRVTAVAEAPPALALLGSAEGFDLLMSDVGLPGMSGCELVQAARRLRPQLPVLFASGYPEQDLLAEVRARDLQAPTDSITKPFSLELLRNRVGALLAD